MNKTYDLIRSACKHRPRAAVERGFGSPVPWLTVNDGVALRYKLVLEPLISIQTESELYSAVLRDCHE